MINAFTVDVEDYFQVSAFEHRISRTEWKDYPSRVVDNTRRLLQLLAQHKTKGTFFVLGWIAAEYPQLIQEIHEQGHELASHGFWHRLVYQQSPAEFRSDVHDSIQAIRDATGANVRCYRAPSFSITKKSQWALQVLVEEGVQVDSSIYPVYHDRYGMPDAQTGIHYQTTTSGRILEFPPSVFQTRVGKIPVSGGGYFRLFPSRFVFSCIRRINKAGNPFMFYIHPWEVDPEQPLISCGSPFRTWRHRVNLRSTHTKLDALLGNFRFGTLTEALTNGPISEADFHVES